MDLVQIRQCFANACSIIRVHLFEMRQLAFDNLIRHTLHRFGNVGEKSGLPVVVEQLEQRPRLAIIIIALAVVIAVRITTDFQRRFGKIRTFNRTVKRVGFIIGIRVGVVGEKSHLTIFVVVIHGAFRCVYGQCLVMRAQAVAVGIGIGKNFIYS